MSFTSFHVSDVLQAFYISCLFHQNTYISWYYIQSPRKLNIRSLPAGKVERILIYRLCYFNIYLQGRKRRVNGSRCCCCKKEKYELNLTSIHRDREYVWKLLLLKKYDYRFFKQSSSLRLLRPSFVEDQ